MQDNLPIFEVYKYLPLTISNIISKLPIEILSKAEEIRLRLNRPLIVTACNDEYFINSKGGYSKNPNNSYIVSSEDIRTSIQLICNFSIYSFEEELKNGFITISGGHRVGICGKTVLEHNKIKTIKDISFLNYRIAKQVIGAADKIIKYLIRSPNSIYNTIIISPPQCGKTTLLRDIVRQLSNGIAEYNFSGKKVVLIDERSELAACSMGIPRNDVGIRTDVLDGCPKAQGIILMIRSMSPEIIATDEIGKSEDADAILDAVNAGVNIITTIHGSSIEDFFRRIAIAKIHKDVFERILILSRRKGVGTIEAIYDSNGRNLYTLKTGGI